MILIDPRAGSSELVAPLAAVGLPVDETTLDFGDVAWMGRGVGGANVWCGLEYKKLPDFVQSLTSDRLSGHQLLGMHGALDAAGYDRTYLVIEGEWDVDGSGHVVVPSKRFRNRWERMKGTPQASVLELRAFVLETRGGMRVRWTRTQDETVRHLTTLYRGWTDRDMDQHKSHLAIHAPDMDPLLKEPITDFRRGLNGAVSGIGFAMSRAIEQRVFDKSKGEGSWEKLRALTEADLAAIEVVDSKGKGRKLGVSRAKHILERLR